MSEYLRGGAGDNKKLSNFNTKAVKKGIAVETEEHGSNRPDIIKELVKDQLALNPHEYDKAKLESIIESLLYDCNKFRI